MVENNRSDVERSILEGLEALREQELAVFTIDALFSFVDRREDFDDPKKGKQLIGRILRANNMAKKLQRSKKEDVRIRVRDNHNPVRVFCLTEAFSAWRDASLSKVKEEVVASTAVLSEATPQLVAEQ